jgi:hypothetical protein
VRRREPEIHRKGNLLTTYNKSTFLPIMFIGISGKSMYKVRSLKMQKPYKTA